MDNDFNGFSAATYEPQPSHLSNGNIVTGAEAEAEGELVLRDNEGRVIFDHSTLPPDALVRVNDKNCVRTAGLEYFSRHTKTSKVWDHGFQVLELGTKKQYWVCTKCKLTHLPQTPVFLSPTSFLLTTFI